MNYPVSQLAINRLTIVPFTAHPALQNANTTPLAQFRFGRSLSLICVIVKYNTIAHQARSFYNYFFPAPAPPTRSAEQNPAEPCQSRRETAPCSLVLRHRVRTDLARTECVARKHAGDLTQAQNRTCCSEAKAKCAPTWCTAADADTGEYSHLLRGARSLSTRATHSLLVEAPFRNLRFGGRRILLL